jgi:RNA-directed DNA polymerase
LPIDEIIIKLLKKYDKNVAYTRYADDITFSSDNENIKNAIRIITDSILPKYGFQANKKKTKVYRNHRKQLVTGLVVNKRVAYPRDKYMILRAKIYNFLQK